MSSSMRDAAARKGRVDLGNFGRVAFCRLWMELDDIRAGRQRELGLHHLVQTIAYTW
jgi:hypothetical protein